MAKDDRATSSSSRHTWRLATILPLVMAILVAMPAIRLPLFYDDLLNNRIIEHLTTATVWLPTPEHTYYRPLFFLLYVIFRDLPGGYPISLMHGINILQHGLNAFLTAALAYRLTRDTWRGFISGMLFALYPFAFQDIASFASTTHLLALNLILTGTHLYLELIEDKKNRAGSYAMLIIVAVLALLTHESAILLAPLLILIHWTKEKPAFTWCTLAKPFLPIFLLDVIYLIVYPLITAKSQHNPGLSMAGMGEKALFVLQGAAYPFASLHTLVGEYSGTFLILGGICLLVIVSFRRISQGDSLWIYILAWGWFFMGGLLVILPLSRDYVIHSPRLLYIPSAGIAILWSLILKRSRAAFRVNEALLLTVIAGISLFALERDIRLLEKIARPVTAMQSIAEISDGDQIVFVNLPEYIVPEPQTFPAGVEFIPLMGPHLYIEELVWLNMKNPTLQAAAIEVPDLLSNNPSFRQAIYAPSDSNKITDAPSETTHHIIITQSENEDITSRYSGSFTSMAEVSGGIVQAGPLMLITAEWDGENTLSLTWQVMDEISPFSVVFTHLLDSGGRMIAQNDGPLLGVPPGWLGLYEGDILTEKRSYDLPHGGIPVTFEIGLYDYTSGERLPIMTTSGEPVEGNAIILPLEGNMP